MMQVDNTKHRHRLRERFLKDEGSSMADYEMLELLLTYAIPRKDVKPIAKMLLLRFGTLADVVAAKTELLVETQGISENSVALIKLLSAVSKRLCWQRLKNADAPVLANWDCLIDYCRTALAYQDVEELKMLFLDAKLILIGQDTVQKGTIDGVAVHPREVVKKAIDNKAKAVVLVHNHPSGKVEPSRADVEVTKQIKTALDLVGVMLIDHIIIGKAEVYSFKQSGLLN